MLRCRLTHVRNGLAVVDIVSRRRVYFDDSGSNNWWRRWLTYLLVYDSRWWRSRSLDNSLDQLLRLWPYNNLSSFKLEYILMIYCKFTLSTTSGSGVGALSTTLCMTGGGVGARHTSRGTRTNGLSEH